MRPLYTRTFRTSFVSRTDRSDPKSAEKHENAQNCEKTPAPDAARLFLGLQIVSKAGITHANRLRLAE